MIRVYSDFSSGLIYPYTIHVPFKIVSILIKKFYENIT